MRLSELTISLAVVYVPHSTQCQSRLFAARELKKDAPSSQSSVSSSLESSSSHSSSSAESSSSHSSSSSPSSSSSQSSSSSPSSSSSHSSASSSVLSVLSDDEEVLDELPFLLETVFWLTTAVPCLPLCSSKECCRLLTVEWTWIVHQHTCKRGVRCSPPRGTRARSKNPSREKGIDGMEDYCNGCRDRRETESTTHSQRWACYHRSWMEWIQIQLLLQWVRPEALS